MIQLSDVREKLSWPLVVSIVFFLAAFVILIAVLIPAKRKGTMLQVEIDQLERTEQTLIRIVEERPTLERMLTGLEADVNEFTQLIPTQYDLPEVLATLAQVAGFYGLTVEDLTHVPLKTQPDFFSGSIPITLNLVGGNNLFAYLEHVQKLFPSLRLGDVVFSYKGSNRFNAAVRSDLQVLIVPQATYSNWEAAEIGLVEPTGAIGGFGLPFEVVTKFLGSNVQVLGVVDAGGRSSALLTQAGNKLWVKVGDRLAEARVSNISASGVVLDVDGVLIKLMIGG